MAELQRWVQEKSTGKVQLNSIQIKDLAYNPAPANSKSELYKEAKKLSAEILQSLHLQHNSIKNPYVLHVHNGNLGKNPRLTWALKLLADRFEKENLPVWILYQMHDFAEDNRPGCWNALRNCSGKPDRRLAVEMMYPRSSRIHWACINCGDREKLLSIGIAKEKVTVLPNSVDVEAFTGRALNEMSREELKQMSLEPMDFAADLKERIAVFARREGFRFEPNRKILLGPVKAIRRKNITELILLLMMENNKDDSFQLLVTLGANSAADIEYCRAIERFVKRNSLPVVIGFGNELLKGGHQRSIKNGRVETYSLIDLMHISEAVLTSSIQEGFGYVFHEPWLAGKAVLGRNIPSVTRDFIAAGLQLGHLYDYLLIPKAFLGGNWAVLVEAYCRKVASLQAEAGLEVLPGERLEALIEQNKTCFAVSTEGKSEAMVDWADLSVDLQLLLLQGFMDDTGLLEEIICTDMRFRRIFYWISEGRSFIIAGNFKIVANRYNLLTKAGRLIALIQQMRISLGSLERISSQGERGNESMFADAWELRNMRLLA